MRVIVCYNTLVALESSHAFVMSTSQEGWLDPAKCPSIGQHIVGKIVTLATLQAVIVSNGWGPSGQWYGLYLCSYSAYHPPLYIVFLETKESTDKFTLQRRFLVLWV